MMIKHENIYIKTTGQTVLKFGSRKQRKRKQKNLEVRNVLINEQYFADIVDGVTRNYPTFITFVPPGMIEDNQKTEIFVIEPDAEHPDGLVHFLQEICFLDKHMTIQLDKNLVTQWSRTKVVKVRSDYTCLFYLDSTA